MSPEHGAAGGSRHASVPAREEAVEARLRALATDLDDGPSPGFRAATRARLVAMAAVRYPEPAPRRGLRALVSHRRPAGRWRARLAAAAAGAALSVTALGALVALSADAGPGDALYGLKRGTEETRLALAGDERGLTLLGFATTRLEELDELVDGAPGRPPADLVRDTLATMDEQTAEGAALVLSSAVDAGDAATLTVVSGWAQEQRSGLSALRSALPEDAGTAAGHSLGLVTEVGSRAGELQTALGCPDGPATAGDDQLGPRATPCGDAGTPDPPAPAARSADPAPPTGTRPAGQAPPAPTSEAPAPAATSSGGGSDSGGAGPSPPSSAPTGGGAPTPTPTPSVPGGEATVPPSPVPDEGDDASTETAPAPVPGGPSGPVLDTPLPICAWPLVC
ncbi:hypothetical protein JOD57_001911 [Geodermatophilus bullaregiensis]|uniref:DUF5667 domain-containing protein n=1 Tax=Geodermatophilus bullaregiensis TaxID=1564160 RepID=UPI00195A7B37|nr:DUF5667 domain-containing protein [Geodermatophilus bullaregiensis]MBM7806074.1 hypothetical protein [Geodermatophilus bullaregiensis]